MKPDDKVWLFGAFPLSVISYWLKPLAVMLLWRWYLVPLGVHAITWATAFGLNVFTFMMRYEWTAKDTAKLTNEQKFESAFGAVLVPAFSLSLGWLVLKLAS
jgi:hypothetical protein